MRKFPRSLVQALKEGRALPFVGAGVSMSVADRLGQRAFPSWLELLERAVQSLYDEDKPDEAYQVQSLIANRHYLPAADIVRSTLTGRRWPAFLREQFDRSLEEIDTTTLGLAEAIWSLGNNFLVTTNYDPVLEWASPRPGDCKSWSTDAPAECVLALDGRYEKPAVWHLHGAIQQADSIILTTESYERLYPSGPAEQALNGALSTLRSLLMLKSFIFIGFSLGDTRFMLELLAVVDAFRGNTGPHYAFVHRDQRAHLLHEVRGLNLELIAFDDYGPPLVDLIRELGQARVRPLPPATRPPAAEPPLQRVEPIYGLGPGVVLGQRYQLEERLGHGGFATVWRARDRSNGQQVALKVLHDHLNADPERVSRFKRGAQRMAELRHPNIVEVLTPVHAEGSFLYFVMELLSSDLGQAVRENRIERASVLPIILKLGSALTFAHGSGLIHRDVKPGNVLLDRNGLPKLTDFDLVLTLDSSGGTRTGALGTFLFAAPEVIADPAGANASADVFGLAMTAVFMFHGAPLGPDAYRSSADFIERCLDCGAATKIVLARACNWHREHRQGSIEEFCAQLAHASASRNSASFASAASGGGPAASGSHTTSRGATVSGSLPNREPGPQAAALSSPRHPGQYRVSTWVFAGAAVLALLGWWKFVDGPPLIVPESAAAEAEAALSNPAPPPTSTSPQTPAEPPILTPPRDEDAATRAAHETLRRLQLPSTGSAKGVTRSALAEIAPMRFIELTGGEFTVGSPSLEPNRGINETQHRVRVEPYLLAESEVSLRQWQAVMGQDPGDREFAQGPNHPVQAVTWTRALEFMNRLSRREGKTACYAPVSAEAAWERGCDGFRLPTEMEFEYAMRAGSSTAYFFDEARDELGEYAWFGGNAGDGPRPVRQLTPNAWGFYDMAGNVWEWVWDRYATYPAAIPPRYVGPDWGNKRVLRGGSFHDSAPELRSANRVADVEWRVARYRGFRVALDLR